MVSPTKKHRRNSRERNGIKTFKHRLNAYIFKKGDICCAADIDQKRAIKDIFNLYIKMATAMNAKAEYLDNLANDLVIFIGYRIDLEKKKDKDGLLLWDAIDQYTSNPVDKTKLEQVLSAVPLYYLLAFLGNAYYKYARATK
jgi:hypothetical protein